MEITAKTLANYLSILELLALVIGGSLMCAYVYNTSLLILIILTLLWLVVLFLENIAINSNSHIFLYIVGGFRMIFLTSLCIIPIILASYYSQTFGT